MNPLTILSTIQSGHVILDVSGKLEHDAANPTKASLDVTLDAKAGTYGRPGHGFVVRPHTRVSVELSQDGFGPVRVRAGARVQFWPPVLALPKVPRR